MRVLKKDRSHRADEQGFAVLRMASGGRAVPCLAINGRVPMFIEQEGTDVPVWKWTKSEAIAKRLAARFKGPVRVKKGGKA